ncbi:MAG: hypothetical protein J5694_03130 [Erysipelotrichaceae bacterium]|nr:hypothetical protein [Erysipelotrichaceae bacterium]
MILTLTDPAAHAEGLPAGEYIPAAESAIEDNPADDSEFNRWVVPGAEDEEIHDFGSGEPLALSPEVIAQDILEPVPSPYDDEKIEVCDATIVSELAEKRDIDTIQFRLTDGSLSAAVYSYPVHEKDADGEWQAIDNRLSLKKDAVGLSYYGREGLHDEVRFAEVPEDGRLLSVETAAGHISWGLLGLSESAKPAAFIPVAVPEGYSLLVPKSAGDHLRYDDILPFIHADYRILGQTIKEDIVLESREALTSLKEGLTFRLEAEGYTVTRTDDRTITFLDSEGTEVYQLTAPVMIDEAGASSSDLSLVLEKQDDGSFLVKLLSDLAWLSSEDRVFPITIDPSLAYLIGGYGCLEASTVYSASPNATENYNIAVGRNYAQDNVRALFKLDSLPTLAESETVIDARVSFVVRLYSAYSSSHQGPVTINLHPLTQSLNLSTATWNTLQGKFSSIVTDSETILPADFNSSAHPRVTWDITKTVKSWYLNGNNYGMAMISENESASTIRYVMLYSAIGSTDTTILPSFQLTYLNQEGLESYLSYHSSGSDTMGVINVGDFNGNLIYTFDDLAMSGAHLPVNISHVYNASQKANLNPANFSAMRFGRGMRLNVSLRVETSSVNGYPYKLTDADGTVHYFSLKSGTSGATGSVYVKEFETNTKLTKTSSGYTLEDGGNLNYTFNSNGYLTSISDITTGKTQTLSYSSNRLTKITDGDGRETTFSYNSSNYLTGITDPAGRTTSYTYNSNNCLTTITRPDGTTVSLTYVSKGGGYLLSKVTDIDGTAVEVTYYNYAPYRVKQLLEKSSSNAEGRKLTWTYNAGETTVTDREGRSETMLFDNSGHTVCIRDGEGGAVSGNFGNSNDNKKHALIYASSLQQSVTNYLSDHGFEQSTSGWSAYSTSTQGSLTQDTSTVHEGTKSLKITSSGSSATYGVFQTVTVPNAAGKMLTLSAYVNYENYTPYSSCGFRLNIRYKNAGGSWVSNYSSAMPAATGWHRVSWTVSVPEDASSDSIQAVIVFYFQTGSGYVDSVQLEEGAVSNRYNLLQNGHIKDAADTSVPSSWSGSNLGSSDKVVSGGHASRGYKITGGSQTAKNIYQNVEIKNGAAGDSYVFGVWAKADSIPKTGLYKNNTRYFAVRIRFIKSDGTYTQSYYSFEAKTPNWQYLSGTATASEAYVKVQIALLYYYQKNTVIYDDVCLFRERYGERCEYDSEGRLTKVTDQAGLVTSYTYLASGRPEVSKVSYPDGTEANYAYDSTTHRLLSITDSSGKVVNYGYDSNGNATAATTTVNGVTITSPINAYSGAYLSSVTDPFGNVTNYSYAQNKGTLESLTNAKNVTTSYTYNSNNDLLTSVQTGSSSVGYAYANHRLTSLSHNTSSVSTDDVVYSLAYNNFGTQTGISVGNQSLVTYTYGTYNGDLIGTTYGNGQTQTPTYDSLGRLSKLRYNGTDAYEYYYGVNGKVGLMKDLAEGSSWRYEYDQAGRITAVTGPGRERHYYTYNSSTGEAVSITVYNPQGTGSYSTSLTYGPYNGTNGERLLKELAVDTDRVKVKYDYDDFYRTTKEVLLNTGYALDTAYSWRPGTDSSHTSFMPSGQTETLKDADNNTVATTSISYIYDSLGNIETISKGGVQRQKYYYDSLNQLIREDNLDLNKTIVYSYDLGGNITSTEEYAYQTGTTVSGAPTTTNSYTYGDSNWKDKLTAYNGNPISYDQIGNPTSYYNGFSFTWQKGRQLASASNGTTTVSYTYNSDGYRTSKTVGDTLIRYTLEGDKVYFEQNGDVELRYFYDASGAPVAFCMGSDQDLYLYRKNLQGDITGVYSGSSGTLLVSYVYDAWGKVTATDVANTTESTEVLTYNPYRYRGYRFDAETGLYYLNSRYYDPETGRFINADAFVSTGQGVLGSNMFAYCIDNPVNLADFDGKDSVPLESINELAWWSSYMWWLCGLDGPFPFGDIIYSLGILLLTGIALEKINSDNPTKTEKEDVKKPEVNYPGDDPAKAPSDDYEWRGKPPQGGEKGGYKNKNGKDSWHPDLKHKGKIGPHWDYNDGKGNHWRVFPDGRIDLKE